MDWVWSIYREHVQRIVQREHSAPQTTFFACLGHSTATAYVMEPQGDTIAFRCLGRWQLTQVPQLLADPNAFLAEAFGGGKFKVNFHHGATFVGTHNFRTYGDPVWRSMPPVSDSALRDDGVNEQM